MVKTGIAGFDRVYGGLPSGHTVLLAGPVGAYTELFGLEFLYRGALEKERCIYVSFEKREGDLIGMASVFDWKLEEEIKGRNLTVMYSELFNYDQFVSSMEDTIFSHKAKRLVFDSISYLGSFFDTPFKFRAALGEMRSMLNKQDCTALLISEMRGDALGPYGMEEFTADGTIQLHALKIGGQTTNAISIPEMRGVDVSSQMYPLEVTKHGLRVREHPLVV